MLEYEFLSFQQERVLLRAKRMKFLQLECFQSLKSNF